MVCPRVVSAMMRKEGAGAAGTELALEAECISLQQILQAFNSTISEEHAWALFHQAARCFQKCLLEGATCYLATEPRHIYLHKDGSVHPTTLLHPGGECCLFAFLDNNKHAKTMEMHLKLVVGSDLSKQPKSCIYIL